jgi:hypothetical protein
LYFLLLLIIRVHVRAHRHISHFTRAFILHRPLILQSPALTCAPKASFGQQSQRFLLQLFNLWFAAQEGAGVACTSRGDAAEASEAVSGAGLLGGNASQICGVACKLTSEQGQL